MERHRAVRWRLREDSPGGRSRARITGDDDFGSLNLGGGSFTVETWVKTDPVSKDYILVGRGDTTYLGHYVYSQFTLNLSQSGALQAKLWNNSNVEWKVEQPRIYDPPTGYWLVDVTDNQWHLVTMVVDESSAQMKLYIDGVERATSSKPANFGTMRSNHGWRVQAGRYDYLWKRERRK